MSALDASLARGLADLEAGRVHDADALFDELDAELEHRRQKLQTFVCDPMLYLFEKKATAYNGRRFSGLAGSRPFMKVVFSDE